METKVTANHSKRTFTIRTESAKYRTCTFTKEEFEELECNTSKDWDYFLSTEDFYYLIEIPVFEGTMDALDSISIR